MDELNDSSYEKRRLRFIDKEKMLLYRLILMCVMLLIPTWQLVGDGNDSELIIDFVVKPFKENTQYSPPLFTDDLEEVIEKIDNIENIERKRAKSQHDPEVEVNKTIITTIYYKAVYSSDLENTRFSMDYMEIDSEDAPLRYGISIGMKAKKLKTILKGYFHSSFTNSGKEYLYFRDMEGQLTAELSIDDSETMVKSIFLTAD